MKVEISPRAFAEIFLGHLHDWSFPMRSRSLYYPQGWDSHQTCKCGATRLYNFALMLPGPGVKEMRPKL